MRSPAPRPAPDPAGPEIVGHPSFSTDVALRIQEATDRFGASVRVQVEGAFVLVDPQHASFFEDEASTVRRTVASLSAGPFPRPLEKPITVSILGTRDAFVRYSKDRYGIDPDKPQLWAYFLRGPREIVVDGMSGVNSLNHELIHPYIAQDWKGGARAPAFLDEGIASQFEAWTWGPDGQEHGVKNWRYAGLLQAMSSKDRGPQTRLDALFGMSDKEFVGKNEQTDEARESVQLWHYAIARYVLQWLDSRDPRVMWRFYEEYRDHRDTDPTGVEAFTRAVGRMETIVGKRGVSTALGAIVEGSERGCASRRSARARGGADEEVLDDVGAFNASDDLLIAAA